MLAMTSVANCDIERRLFVDIGESDKETPLRICAAVLELGTRAMLTLVSNGYCDIPGLYWIGEEDSFESLAIKSLSQVLPFSKGRLFGWKNRSVLLCPVLVQTVARSKGLLLSPYDVEIFHWNNMESLPLTRLFVDGRLVGKVIPIFSEKSKNPGGLSGLVFVYEASLNGFEYISPGNTSGDWRLSPKVSGRMLMSAEAREVSSIW